MNRLVPRVAGWAMLAAGAVAGVSGCMVTGSGETAAEVQKDASMVSLMIGNQMGVGPVTEPGLIQIVEDSGGGYVTAINRSGRVGTPGERTVVHAILGTSRLAVPGPIDEMGPPNAPAAVLCYRFTVGYYPYQVWQAQEQCPRLRPVPAGGLAEAEAIEEMRVQAAENVISELPRAAQAPVQAAPASLPQAVRLLGLDRHTHRVHRILVLPLTGSEFAVDHGRAALALRLRAGGCVYVSLPDNPDGGLPGPWLSPVHARCTGAAALAASGWVSVNPALGG